MSAPTINQMRCRMTGVHRKLLEAARDGRKIVAQRPGDAAGYMTCRATLLRWGAIEGDSITDIGRALLAKPGTTTVAEFREANPGTPRDAVCGGAA
jgi:hypothetical protein